MDSVNLDVRYELGHSYHERWHRTDLFCPSCGKQTVWDEDGMGDIEMGPRYLCECGASFYSHNEPQDDNWQDSQRRAAFAGNAVV